MEVTLTDTSIAWLHDKRIFFETKSSTNRMKKGGVIRFNNTLKLEPYCGILSGNTLFDIGSFSYSWTSLPATIEVGRYCSIAQQITIPRPRHPIDKLSSSSFMYDRGFSIIQSHISDSGKPYSNFKANPQKAMPMIGNDVWIGYGASLMPGITIGDGAVIAAHSVVTKDVGPYEIVGGNPAKFIRLRFPTETIDKLMESEWWKYSFMDFSDLDIEAPERFADQFLERKGDLPLYQPTRIQISDIIDHLN